MTRRALIIDDEPLARVELHRLLRAHPEVAVVGEAGTFNEASERLALGGFDLVFLDVQLRGGSGFDLVDRIPPAAEVIFVTAYNRYAVRAFEVNALDYLLKPVAAPRLSAALKRLEPSPAASGETAAAPKGRLTPDDRVLIRTSGAAHFVPVSAIAAVRSCENYTEVFLAGGNRLLVLRSLKSWADALPAETFARVHRQALVNLAHVRAMVRGEADEVRFELTVPSLTILGSRRQMSELRGRLFSLEQQERIGPRGPAGGHPGGG